MSDFEGQRRRPPKQSRVNMSRYGVADKGGQALCRNRPKGVCYLRKTSIARRAAGVLHIEGRRNKFLVYIEKAIKTTQKTCWMGLKIVEQEHLNLSPIKKVEIPFEHSVIHARLDPVTIWLEGFRDGHARPRGPE